MICRVFAAMLLVLSAIPASAGMKSDAQDVSAMLDDWYAAAEKGDGQRYFSHLTDDAIFLGTDPDERWTISAFRQRFEKYFNGKNAWTYVTRERHILFSLDHKIGWFDEKLISPKYGEAEFRSTGVVVKSKGKWLIAQYSLTFLVPNGAVAELKDKLKPSH